MSKRETTESLLRQLIVEEIKLLQEETTKPLFPPASIPIILRFATAVGMKPDAIKQALIRTNIAATRPTASTKSSAETVENIPTQETTSASTGTTGTTSATTALKPTKKDAETTHDLGDLLKKLPKSLSDQFAQFTTVLLAAPETGNTAAFNQLRDLSRRLKVMSDTNKAKEKQKKQEENEK